MKIEDIDNFILECKKTKSDLEKMLLNQEHFKIEEVIKRTDEVLDRIVALNSKLEKL